MTERYCTWYFIWSKFEFYISITPTHNTVSWTIQFLFFLSISISLTHLSVHLLLSVFIFLFAPTLLFSLSIKDPKSLLICSSDTTLNYLSSTSMMTVYSITQSLPLGSPTTSAIYLFIFQSYSPFFIFNQRPNILAYLSITCTTEFYKLFLSF